MDDRYVILSSSSTINNANIEKYCTSDFTLYTFTQIFFFFTYNVKIHGSTAKKKEKERDSLVTFRKVIQAQDSDPPSRPQTTHPLSTVWVSGQAGDHDQCCPWMSRRWKCCCVGWHATETQHLHGWDFLLGSALQPDTETAVNQSPSSCVYGLYYVTGGGGV